MKVVAIKIDPGSHPGRCESCGRVIYWGKYPTTGKLHPVSVNGMYLSDARIPSGSRAGAGVSHFIDCPTRNQHRKPREKQPELELWGKP